MIGHLELSLFEVFLVFIYLLPFVVSGIAIFVYLKKKNKR